MIFIKKYLFSCSIIVCFIGFNTLYAQQINELKEKKKKIEKEIENISSLIDKTEKESSNSLTNIKLTQRKIELKNNLISQIDKEVDEVTSEIEKRKERIDSLSNRIGIIKDEYKRIIVFAQKTKYSNNIVLQIFSAKDFNQAYKRLRFYKQVLDYKQQIAINYSSGINLLKDETIKLNVNINQLNKKQLEKEKEVSSLKNDEKVLKKKVDNLTNKKKKLIADLEEQKKISNRLNDEIRRLIEDEAKRESERMKKNKTVNVNYATLSSNFKENLGKLSLPVQDGLITGIYGESFHPILKEVKIRNNGIDITISRNSPVIAIFKGEVRKIINIPGANLAVIVRHGNYLTVYSNLSKVNVAVGQEINSYQKIGEINLQKGEETAILHFELWNENKTEDPGKWFKK